MSSSSQLATTNGTMSLAPASTALDDLLPSDRLMQFCQMIATSNMVPKDFRGRPGDVLIAVQMGVEVGLKPTQALQSIAVINGRPSLWGDGALAVVRARPDCRDIVEKIEGAGDNRIATCSVTRAGMTPVVRSFSVADAKKANLWNKEGPWRSYPDRMLQMRARGFALRDAFPDALKGFAIAEEAMDIPADGAPDYAASETPAPTPGASRTSSVRDKMRAQVTSVQPVQQAEETPQEPAPAPTPSAASGDGSLFANTDNLATSQQLEGLRIQAQRKGVKAEQFEEIIANFGGVGQILKTQLAGIQQAIDDAAEGAAE